MNFPLRTDSCDSLRPRAGADPERLLIVEVNPNLPRTRSLAPRFDNTLPVEIIDVMVETGLAIDVPSGVDADTGAVAGAALPAIFDNGLAR